MKYKFKPATRHTLLLKPFRDKHGITQDEMALLLDISRAQLSMAESRWGVLPATAVEKFSKLQQDLLVAPGPAIGRPWAEQAEEKRQNFKSKCEQQLIETQYRASQLAKELPDLEKQEEEQLAVIRHWDTMPHSVKDKTLPYLNIDTIYRRCFAKLAKCDISARLDKQLQIKILLARVDVLKQFIAGQHPA